MHNRNRPGTQKNIRIPFDLMDLIEDIRLKEGKNFTEFVVERLRLTFSDDWDFTGQRIKYANSRIKKWEDEKVFYKEIRLKEVKRRQAVKEEAKRQELGEAETTEADKKAIIINDTRLLQDHVEGRLQLWIKDDDPMNFMWFSAEPSAGYSKLEKGQLNKELLQFYNDNFHLLV